MVIGAYQKVRAGHPYSVAVIVEYVRYRVPTEAHEAFLAAYARAAGSLAASPHCLDYELTQCHEEPERFVLRIRWDGLDGHREGFRRSDGFGSFFAEVRPFVDAIEEMQHYAPTEVAGVGAGTDQPPSLYEWAGGQEALERLFARLYETVLADELLAPLFRDMSPEHPRHVAAWVGEVFGGPTHYTDRHGGYPTMLGHHLGRSITEAQRRRWVSLLTDAADEVGLPADPEFRSAFLAYLEWGTRIAVENSQPGATPPSRAPVPRWGWGEAPPWQG